MHHTHWHIMLIFSWIVINCTELICNHIPVIKCILISLGWQKEECISIWILRLNTMVTKWNLPYDYYDMTCIHLRSAYYRWINLSYCNMIIVVNKLNIRFKIESYLTAYLKTEHTYQTQFIVWKNVRIAWLPVCAVLRIWIMEITVMLKHTA